MFETLLQKIFACKTHRFPHRRQLNIKDCGAACLQMIAEHYGKKYSLATLREYSCISREGASLMGLCDAAERIGFQAQGVCVTLESLKRDIPLPCILYWNKEHYVVCYKIERKSKKTLYHISDPATMQSTYGEEEFLSRWVSTVRQQKECGILLRLTPRSNFQEFTDENSLGREHSLRHFTNYLKPYKAPITYNILCLFLFMVLELFVPFLTQSLVDVGIKGSNLNFVLLILAAQILLTLTNMSLRMINSWVNIHVNTRINLSMVSDFWRKVLKLPMSFFDTKVTGDIMNRFGDLGRIENLLLHNAVSIAFAAVSFLVYVAILAYYNYSILLVFAIGHIAYVAWICCFLKAWKRIDYQNFELTSKNKNKTLQLLQGVVDIKLSNEEHHKRWEWEDIQARIFKLSLKSLKLRQLQDFVGELITDLTFIVISYMMAKAVIEGEMSLGMMMAIIFITGQIRGPVEQFVGFVRVFQDAKISLERLNEVNVMTDDDSQVATQRTDIELNQDITLNQVSFSYEGSHRTLVLHNISLTIPYHKVTAIVGDSGCGKTTVMKLLMGLYQPTEGEVKIGAVSLAQINPHWWRSHIGAVMQDGYLFSDTIARNIGTGDLEMDKERLDHAAKMANIHDFIDRNPLGYNLKIGMEGAGVSQGQKQRILIARAIYKNPSLLLFDEATNALDSCNEKEIMDNLSSFFTDKTVVIAAHRLSTIKNADQIVVMKEGKVVEVGSHDSLMQLQGEYCRLINNQM